MQSSLLSFLNTGVRPTLKSCLFPIHQPGEIKNSHEPPVDRNFFFAIILSKKIYDKIFKKIGSWYNKNVPLDIFIFNFFVQFLCWFIIIWYWWLISIKVLLCFPIQIEHLNILANLWANSLLCRPTLIRYVPWLRLIKKTRWQTWPLSFD